MKEKVELLVIRSKECGEHEKVKLEIPEVFVIKKISSLLHFTAQDIKPAFDALTTSACTSIRCLEEYAEKQFREEIAVWIITRLKILQQFVNENVIELPLCLEQYDEIVRRMIVGILYAVRSKIPWPIVLDDALSFIINNKYAVAWPAMMRPYKFSINQFLETRELLAFNPIVIAPGGHGGLYRLARPDKYVILFDGFHWEIPRREIGEIVNS
jgi:hypothetical protein